MRAIVERVRWAQVRVAGDVVGRIGPGLLVYVAAAPDDADRDVDYVAQKVVHLRVFCDADGKLNRSVREISGSVLVVSAFSVLGDVRHGRRPSFHRSAPGPIAAPLIEALVRRIAAGGVPVQTGRFAAMMEVEAVNDGPICILLDSRRVI